MKTTKRTGWQPFINEKGSLFRRQATGGHEKMPKERLNGGIWGRGRLRVNGKRMIEVKESKGANAPSRMNVQT